jgi:hypothetical protein
MCGIVGIINDNKHGAFAKDLNVFRSLLIADSLRGSHGTGIMGIDVDGNSDYRKLVGDPFGLLRAEGVDQWLFGASTKWRMLVGHNRYATTGTHTTLNAHPFSHGPIMMVHNGTLQAWSSFNTKKFEVDSESLCFHMSEVGIKQALEETAGAVATVVYNRETEEVSFFRNIDRPLYIGYSKSLGKIMFASELPMLHWICTREGWDSFRFSPLPMDTLLTMSIHTIEQSVEEDCTTKKYHHAYQGGKGGGYARGGMADEDWYNKRSGYVPPTPNYQGYRGQLPPLQQQQQPTQQSGVVVLPPITEGSKSTNVIPISKRSKLEAQREAKQKRQQEPAVHRSGNDLIVVDSLKGVKAGQELIWTVLDVKQLNQGKNPAFLLEGMSEDCPDVVLRYRCDDPIEIDILEKASYLRSTVRKMLYYTKDDRRPGLSYDVMWMGEPEIVKGLEDEHSCSH